MYPNKVEGTGRAQEILHKVKKTLYRIVGECENTLEFE